MSTKHCQKTSAITLPNLHALAKESLLVIRESPKFCPSVFLMTLMQSASSGHASFNKMAGALGESLAPMSKQGLSARFSPKSTKFLQSVLYSLMEQRLSPVRSTLEYAGTKRIIVEDSSAVSLPKKNAKCFPAHGNAHGKTAGLKIDFAYDLKSGQCVSHTLEKATEQDKSIGKETVTLAEEGDLFLRDMGYFILEDFDYLEEQGASWVTRLPMNCKVSTMDGKTLESVLKNTELNQLDLEVFAGEKKQKRCRLVAVRADQNVVEQKHRKRKADAQKKGKKPSQDSLTRDGWHLILTSLSKEQASVEEIGHLYTCRWSIELQFRGLKDALNLKKALNRITNKYHIEALVLAAMITHQLSQRVWNLYYKILHEVGKTLSLEKLFANLVIFLSKLTRLEEINQFKPDLRHIAYEKRTRQDKVNTGFFPLA